MKFKDRLRELRLSQGLTQGDLSLKLGNTISDSTIGMYEQGKRQPSVENLEILSDFFNVDTDYILGKTDYTTRIVNPNDNSISAQILSQLDKLTIEEQTEVLEDLKKIIDYKVLLRRK